MAIGFEVAVASNKMKDVVVANPIWGLIHEWLEKNSGGDGAGINHFLMAGFR